MKKLYVGNLSDSTKDQDLVQLFSKFGGVVSATVVRDKFDNSSRRFGFVEMQTQPEADEAIKNLDGTSLNASQITVNVARPKRDDGGQRYGNNSNNSNRW